MRSDVAGDSATRATAPRVSVVMIFLNAERFIAEAIDSVLRQSFDSWELLLIDDGSTNASTAIAQRYAREHPSRVRYFTHPRRANRGMSASRNLAIRHARAALVTFLDADDVWQPHAIETMVRLCDAQPDAAMIYGPTLWWHGWTGRPADAARDSSDHVDRRAPAADTIVAAPLLLENFLLDGHSVPCMCSAMMHRDVLRSVGGFERRLRGMYEDQVMYTKLAAQFPVYVTSELWALYRQHGESCCAQTKRAGRATSARQTFLHWLRGYLNRIGMKNSRAARLIDDSLNAHRRPATVLEVAEIRLADVDESKLRGRNLELPRIGRVPDGRRIDVIGWALGRESPATAVELVDASDPASGVLARAPIDVPRPDLASAFAEPWAARAGFHASALDLLTTTATNDVSVCSVLADGTRVPIGSIHLRRRTLRPVRGNASANGHAPRKSDRAIVLLYHRVTEVSRDPWNLCVSPQNFAEQMDVLTRYARPIPLAQIDRLHDSQPLPERAVVVTFDDGYADNLTSALPILRQHAVRATVFITAAQIGSAQEFWWDELERIVFDSDSASPDESLRMHYDELQPMDDQTRRTRLDELAAQLSASREARATHLPLSEEQLQELSRCELIELGGHTLTHPRLSSLSRAEQSHEILGGKNRLEQIVGRVVKSFAYPHGVAGTYDDTSVAVVREAGFERACIAEPGIVGRETDSLHIPRIEVRDWDGETFARHLAGWLIA